MLQGSLVCLASPAYTILLHCNTIHKLGILLLLDLRWETHIDYIISKAVSSLYFLKQLKRAGLPSSHLSHFYITVIRPILEYASPSYSDKVPSRAVGGCSTQGYQYHFWLFLTHPIFCYFGYGWHSIPPSKTLGSFQAFLQKNLST